MPDFRHQLPSQSGAAKLDNLRLDKRTPGTLKRAGCSIEHYAERNDRSHDQTLGCHYFNQCLVGRS